MKCPYGDCTFEADRQDDIDEHVTYMIVIVGDSDHDPETLPDPDGAGPGPGPEGWQTHWSKEGRKS